MESDRPARQLPLPRHRPVLHPAPPTFLVGAGNEGCVGVPVLPRRSPHRLRLGAHNFGRTIALELPAIAAIDQAPVGPGLGNDGLEVVHAALAIFPPTLARACGPESICAPAARTSSIVTASRRVRISLGSTRRPSR